MLVIVTSPGITSPFFFGIEQWDFLIHANEGSSNSVVNTGGLTQKCMLTNVYEVRFEFVTSVSNLRLRASESDTVDY